MKRIFHSHLCFHILILFTLSLTACKTMSSSEKAVSKSETASVTESRLAFYRTMDSLSRQLILSIDSITIVYNNSNGPELPIAFASEMKGSAESPGEKGDYLAARNASRQNKVLPKSLKVYGLHLTENSEEKSISNADLKDSVNKFTQSENVKSATKQSSRPSNAPKYVFYIIVVIASLNLLYKICPKNK